jgi:hypothetical protein
MSEAHDSAKLQPRVIRFRDAPYYLGMDRNRFNAEVRPYLTEIPIGKQGVGFDGLNWTRGWTSMSPATGVPHRKEFSSRHRAQRHAPA